MAGETNALEAQDVEQGDNVGCQLGLQVGAAWCVGPAEAAQIGTDHPVALRQRADQASPGEPVLRPAVQQDQRLAVGGARAGDVHPEPAHVDELVLDSGELWDRPFHVGKPR